jgi:hypothetical protein
MDGGMIVVDADRGKDPRRRWVARARSDGDGLAVEAVEPWGRRGPALARLGLADDQPGPILIGADLPVGLPRAYAERTGIASFPDALPRVG